MKQFKGINGAIIKDLDTKQGIVTGYYSVFGNIDSDGDMIMPGAFLKTISENGPEGKNRIMHLWQHNPLEPIGKPSVLKEDAEGLYFETKLAQTSRGIDTLKLYEDGIINEHSIGFNVVKKETKSDHTAIHEIKLWEGSTVTWGANSATRTTGMKSMDANSYLTQKERIYQALKKGTYTDETFLMLIEQLEFFDNELKSLEQISIQPESEVSQVTTDTESEKLDDVLAFFLLTKNKTLQQCQR
jgi:HK97 family phage prohead protease